MNKFILCVLIAILTPLGFTQTYVASHDFSIRNGNPNGVWSYGCMTANFDTLSLYQTAWTPVTNHHQWCTQTRPDYTPCIWKNMGPVSSDGVPSGMLSLHPGPGNEPSVLRWTAPQAGTIAVRAIFSSGDRGAMAIAVHYNGRQLWSENDQGVYNASSMAVNVGDTIDFLVYGGYSYGNTPLEVTIWYK